jgi:hypothetical protein
MSNIISKFTSIHRIFIVYELRLDKFYFAQKKLNLLSIIVASNMCLHFLFAHIPLSLNELSLTSGTISADKP